MRQTALFMNYAKIKCISKSKIQLFFKISRSFCNMHRDLKCVRTHLVIHTYVSDYTYGAIGLHIYTHRFTRTYVTNSKYVMLF